MAWTLLDTDAIHSALTENERAAAAEAMIDGALANPVTEQIAHTTDFVRGYIRQKYDLEATGLPPSLILPAVDIICYRLVMRVAPNLAEFRKPAYDNALSLLRDVAAGRFDPRDTLTPEPDDERDSAVEVACSTVRQATRATLDGLV